MSKIHRHVSEVLAEAVAEIELRQQYPEVSGPRSGLAALDDRAAEAFAPGSLVVVAGESGRGKTAFLTQLAVSFAAQTPTLVVTLEDAARDTIKRGLANVSRENVGRIRRGFDGDATPATVTDAVKHLDGLALWFVDEMTLTVEAIARVVWQWQQEHGLTDSGYVPVVLIDQLSHVAPSTGDPSYYVERGLPAPPGRGAPETKVLEWQTWVLKAVAQRLGVCVVLAHQLNEDHGDGKPGVRSIRGSRGIVHKADLVLIPWVPAEVPNPFAGPGQPGKIPNVEGEGWLICPKARGVSMFEEKVRWVGAQQRFVDLDDDTAATYVAPAAPSDAALEGARKLAELRAGFAAARDRRLVSASPRGEVEA